MSPSLPELLHTAGLTPASFYEAFPEALAHRLARKLEIHSTPKHGSWLNMAEIERSVLSRQCLSRRLGSFGEAERQVQAWEAHRNQDQAKVNWRFTTPDARIKLKRLYPSQEDRLSTRTPRNEH